jgi:hypothetical protein
MYICAACNTFIPEVEVKRVLYTFQGGLFQRRCPKGHQLIDGVIVLYTKQYSKARTFIYYGFVVGLFLLLAGGPSNALDLAFPEFASVLRFTPLIFQLLAISLAIYAIYRGKTVQKRESPVKHLGDNRVSYGIGVLSCVVLMDAFGVARVFSSKSPFL